MKIITTSIWVTDDIEIRVTSSGFGVYKRLPDGRMSLYIAYAIKSELIVMREPQSTAPDAKDAP